jgi:hypothetical protein
VGHRPLTIAHLGYSAQKFHEKPGLGMNTTIPPTSDAMASAPVTPKSETLIASSKRRAPIPKPSVEEETIDITNHLDFGIKFVLNSAFAKTPARARRRHERTIALLV